MVPMLAALVATAALIAVAGAQALEAAAPAATEADYVVVGGGTAGCALAARLCEGLPHTTVVLLERATPRTQAQVRCLPAPVTAQYTPRAAADSWRGPNRVCHSAREWLTSACRAGGCRETPQVHAF